MAGQEASVKQASQQLAQATREYQSYKSLGPISTSAKEMGRAKDAVTQAQLSLKIEQSKLVVTKGAAANSVADATRQLKVASAAEEIRAPIDGTILFVDKRVGAHPAGPIVRMGDLRTMYVVCQVYEGDLLKLRRGMRATIKSTTLPHSARAARWRASDVSSTLAPSSATCVSGSTGPIRLTGWWAWKSRS